MPARSNTTGNGTGPGGSITRPASFAQRWGMVTGKPAAGPAPVSPFQAAITNATSSVGAGAQQVTQMAVDPALLAYLRQVQANETQINASAQSNIDAINSGLSANVRGALMQTADNLRQSQSQAVLAGNRRSGRYEEKVARQRAAGMDQINAYQAQAASQISAASANAAQQIANLRMQAGEQRLASQQRNQQMGLYRPQA